MEDIKKVTVLEPASKDVDFGEVFTNEFREYAKAKNKTYVLMQWEKDSLKEATFDFVNCDSPNKAIMQAREVLSVNKKKEDK